MPKPSDVPKAKAKVLPAKPRHPGAEANRGFRDPQETLTALQQKRAHYETAAAYLQAVREANNWSYDEWSEALADLRPGKPKTNGVTVRSSMTNPNLNPPTPRIVAALAIVVPDIRKSRRGAAILPQELMAIYEGWIVPDDEADYEGWREWIKSPEFRKICQGLATAPPPPEPEKHVVDPDAIKYLVEYTMETSVVSIEELCTMAILGLPAVLELMEGSVDASVNIKPRLAKLARVLTNPDTDDRFLSTEALVEWCDSFQDRE